MMLPDRPTIVWDAFIASRPNHVFCSASIRTSIIRVRRKIHVKIPNPKYTAIQKEGLV